MVFVGDCSSVFLGRANKQSLQLSTLGGLTGLVFAVFVKLAAILDATNGTDTRCNLAFFCH